MKQSIFEASEALQKWEGIILKKTRSFHQYSCNSEVGITSQAWSVDPTRCLLCKYLACVEIPSLVLLLTNTSKFRMSENPTPAWVKDPLYLLHIELHSHCDSRSGGTFYIHTTELNINAKVYGRQQRLHERTFTSNSSPWCCVQICLQHAKTLCCCWLCCLVGMCNMSMGERDFLYFYVVWRLSKQKLSTYNHTTLCSSKYS